MTLIYELDLDILTNLEVKDFKS